MSDEAKQKDTHISETRIFTRWLAATSVILLDERTVVEINEKSEPLSGLGRQDLPGINLFELDPWTRREEADHLQGLLLRRELIRVHSSRGRSP